MTDGVIAETCDAVAFMVAPHSDETDVMLWSHGFMSGALADCESVAGGVHISAVALVLAERVRLCPIGVVWPMTGAARRPPMAAAANGIAFISEKRLFMCI